MMRDGFGSAHEAWRPPPPGEAADVRPRAKVLIVDDDERNAYAAVQALEELGHELVIARSGEEALRHLLADDFAVILLDLHMPGMDGYETARFIRAHRRTRGTPIVFLTAVFRDEAHLFQAYSAGAVDVVFKPVDPFILRSKVTILVELHLKKMEIQRQAEHLQALLVENTRIHAEKLSAERALRKTRERQEAIMRTLPIVFTSRTATYPFGALFVSEGIEGLTGFESHHFTSDPAFGLDRIHPDDRDGVISALSGAAKTGTYACEFRWKCADGTWRHFIDQGVIAPSQDGDATEIFGTLLDSTDRKSLEEQLTQARKMEAVGQLTGGVAHDFNNLLTVILGNADLIIRKVGDNETVHRQLSAIRHAAERGRTLTRQLLAFSRRERLTPVAVDLNQLIRDFLPLMRQAVGEAVTLTAETADQPICVEVDPAHLETALLNLAVNARDAMPSGGELRVSAALVNVKAAEDKSLAPGDWARIVVRDTGFGMDPQVASRIFEPFFTTKEVGKGSGLGLSQVYGFVRQSGGHVRVQSAPGRGAEFELFLPPTDRPADERPTVNPTEQIEGGAERLLVVEDDPAVLAFTVDLLKGLGYEVTTATDAKSALSLIRGKKRIDGLFSDVIMPGGLSGIELAKAAREIRPDLKILLTSGYVGERPAEIEAFPLIDKPYERSALAAKLREVLSVTAPAALPPKPKKRGRSASAKALSEA